MDLEIYRFKNSIISIVNASDLPLEVKRMCLAEITMAVSDAAKNALGEQIRQFNEQKQLEKKGGE